MYSFLIKLIPTFFFVGYLPLVPGTWGSLAGLVIYYFTHHNLVYFLLIPIFLILGFGFCTKAEKKLERKDSPKIVIDEVAGMLLCFLFLPFSLQTLILGFFIFRLLDAVKPYPANKLQRLSGAPGIMGDDIVAAFYTNLILQVVTRLT